MSSAILFLSFALRFFLFCFSNNYNNNKLVDILVSEILLILNRKKFGQYRECFRST